MAYVPYTAEWFWANIMMEIRVEGWKRNAGLIKTKKPM
jgi:hypothetical protein